MNTGHAPSLESDREITLTRIVDAPRELVWRMWTEPQHIANWWGPRGFTHTTQTMEVKPGGVWRYVMHGPDGRDYPNLVTYLEIVKPERIVYKHGGEKDCEPVNFQTTVTFDKAGASGNQTRVTLHSTFPSKSARDFVVSEYNAIEGGKQTLARLGEHLSHVLAADPSNTGEAGRPLHLTRVFHAPHERIYELWTRREHLMHWFGPKGCTIPSCTLDLRPDGEFRYQMHLSDGATMLAKWTFREITPRERLVFVSAFCDQTGRTTQSPFSQDWPLEILATVTFAEHAGIGRGTVVAVQWAPLNATRSQQAAFDAGLDSMRQGWAETFERFTDYLART